MMALQPSVSFIDIMMADRCSTFYAALREIILLRQMGPPERRISVPDPSGFRYTLALLRSAITVIAEYDGYAPFPGNFTMFSTYIPLLS